MNNHPFKMVPMAQQVSIKRWYYLSSFALLVVIIILASLSIRDYCQIKALKNNCLEKEYAVSHLTSLKDSLAAYQLKIVQLETAQAQQLDDKKNALVCGNFFRAISSFIPADVALETVRFQKGSAISLTGVSYRFEAVDNFIKKLQSLDPSTTLSLDSLQSINSNRPNEPTIRFKLIAHRS